MLVVFVAMAGFAWERMIDAPENAVLAAGSSPPGSTSDFLTMRASRSSTSSPPACPASSLTRHALFATEFFNVTVDRAAYLGDSIPDGIPLDRLEVVDGRLVFEDGRPFVADFVYTQPGIELSGERLATGTAAGLVLWETGGEVRMAGAQTTDDVRTADCA